MLGAKAGGMLAPFGRSTWTAREPRELQQALGAVGTEAGCPKACRCCCPMTRDNSEKKRTAKFKMAAVAATGTTITV